MEEETKNPTEGLKWIKKNKTSNNLMGLAKKLIIKCNDLEILKKTIEQHLEKAFSYKNSKENFESGNTNWNFGYTLAVTVYDYLNKVLQCRKKLNTFLSDQGYDSKNILKLNWKAKENEVGEIIKLSWSSGKQRKLTAEIDGTEREIKYVRKEIADKYIQSHNLKSTIDFFYNKLIEYLYGVITYIIQFKLKDHANFFDISNTNTVLENNFLNKTIDNNDIEKIQKYFWEENNKGKSIIEALVKKINSNYDPSLGLFSNYYKSMILNKIVTVYEKVKNNKKIENLDEIKQKAGSKENNSEGARSVYDILYDGGKNEEVFVDFSLEEEKIEITVEELKQKTIEQFKESKQSFIKIWLEDVGLKWSDQIDELEEVVKRNKEFFWKAVLKFNIKKNGCLKKKFPKKVTDILGASVKNIYQEDIEKLQKEDDIEKLEKSRNDLINDLVEENINVKKLTDELQDKINTKTIKKKLLISYKKLIEEKFNSSFPVFYNVFLGILGKSDNQGNFKLGLVAEENAMPLPKAKLKLANKLLRFKGNTKLKYGSNLDVLGTFDIVGHKVRKVLAEEYDKQELKTIDDFFEAQKKDKQGNKVDKIKSVKKELEQMSNNDIEKKINSYAEENSLNSKKKSILREWLEERGIYLSSKDLNKTFKIEAKRFIGDKKIFKVEKLHVLEDKNKANKVSGDDLYNLEMKCEDIEIDLNPFLKNNNYFQEENNKKKEAEKKLKLFYTKGKGNYKLKQKFKTFNIFGGTMFDLLYLKEHYWLEINYDENSAGLTIKQRLVDNWNRFLGYIFFPNDLIKVEVEVDSDTGEKITGKLGDKLSITPPNWDTLKIKIVKSDNKSEDFINESSKEIFPSVNHSEAKVNELIRKQINDFVSYIGNEVTLTVKKLKKGKLNRLKVKFSEAKVNSKILAEIDKTQIDENDTAIFEKGAKYAFEKDNGAAVLVAFPDDHETRTVYYDSDDDCFKLK
ncbi:hypothetical protein [Halanaerobacter jeridensis]|uniref:Uncharacterized protein n=1 Tax=Halanaerobacter jeridensis TaxID=706427 RepID=A0A939BT30_9FIRM|nr:hypothetical protein [Halanaerobacter jeridensis]MBM7557796.1 hypothetical protein [Halanaerobacter jeridensis]